MKVGDAQRGEVSHHRARQQQQCVGRFPVHIEIVAAGQQQQVASPHPCRRDAEIEQAHHGEEQQEGDGVEQHLSMGGRQRTR